MESRALSLEAADRRSEPRFLASKYYSVEFSINGLELPYQFKIWNMASQSMCVLIREESEILPRIKVGDVIDMKYYTSSSSCPSEEFRTEIRHITKDEEGKFKGHYLVGISILTKNDQEMAH